MITHEQVVEAAQELSDYLHENFLFGGIWYPVRQACKVSAQGRAYKKCLRAIQAALKESRREGAPLTTYPELWPKVARLQYFMEKRREGNKLLIQVVFYLRYNGMRSQTFSCPKRALRYIENGPHDRPTILRWWCGGGFYYQSIQGRDEARQQLARLYREQPKECA